jgi:hypothetical protein
MGSYFGVQDDDDGGADGCGQYHSKKSPSTAIFGL